MSVKSVEEYIRNHMYWKDELELFRELMRSTELMEAIKWGAPCYVLEGKNVVGFAAFQNHCAIWIYQGALLTEDTALLYNAQEGKTKAMRQIRFSKGQHIDLGLLRKYILEAIQLQKDGKEIKPDYSQKLVVPVELGTKLETDCELKSAFERLTQARQREYAEYVSGAKREETKNRRLEKISPMILNGFGLNDKYRTPK